MSAPLEKRARIEAPTTAIVDLNDDVLREIFKKVDASDLLSIGRVCSKFLRIVEEGYKISSIDTLEYRYSIVSLTQSSPSKRTVRLRNGRIMPALRIFGPHLMSLDIDLRRVEFRIRPNLVLETIVNCCPKLKTLKLDGFYFTDDMVLRLRSILPKISHLTLWKCEFENESGVSTLFAFRSDYNAIDSFDHNHDAFKFDTDFHRPIRESAMESFLANNPQLSQIRLNQCGFGIIPFMVRYTPEIEKYANIGYSEIESYFRTRINDEDGLANLKKLKSLDLSCYELQIVPLLEKLKVAQIHLKHLQLRSVRASITNNSELANAISQFTQLKALEVWFSPTPDGENFFPPQLIRILKRLDELVFLRIHKCRVSDTFEIVHDAPKLEKIKYDEYFATANSNWLRYDWFKQMLRIVKVQNRKVPLIFSCLKHNRIDVPTEVLEANRGILQIEYHNLGDSLYSK